MSDPVKYLPSYSFTGYQATDPASPLPAPQLDTQLNAISISLDEAITGLLDIRRSDGALKNGVVTVESLAEGLYDQLTAAVDGHVDEANAAADAAVAARNTAQEHRDAAAASAGDAQTSASSAAVSADAAAAALEDFGEALTSASATVLTVGEGEKTFTVEAGKHWIPGQRLRATTDDGAEFMEGDAVSYSGTTLILDVDVTGGSGAHADWTICVAGAKGFDAWVPVMASVSDGERRVIQVVDWTGGEGDKPATGQYVGPSGYVATAAEATNIRGATGLSGGGTGDMLAANNLGDLEDVSAARDNLGVAIGSDVQAHSPILAAEAGLSPADDRISYFTSAATKALATFTSFGRTLIACADAAAVRTALGLVIGTNVQAQSANLAAEAGLTGAADQVSYYTGSGTKDLATLNALGRSIIGAASAAAARTAIGAVIGTDVQAYDADTLKSDVSANLTKGYTTTEHPAGTKTSGTFTPDPADGNMQIATNGGAHTFAPPSSTCTMTVHYVNNSSAGAITTSGFTKVTGDSLTTTNGNEFLFYVVKSGTKSHLHIQALQ